MCGSLNFELIAFLTSNNNKTLETIFISFKNAIITKDYYIVIQLIDFVIAVLRLTSRKNNYKKTTNVCLIRLFTKLNYIVE